MVLACKRVKWQQAHCLTTYHWWLVSIDVNIGFAIFQIRWACFVKLLGFVSYSGGWGASVSECACGYRMGQARKGKRGVSKLDGYFLYVIISRSMVVAFFKSLHRKPLSPVQDTAYICIYVSLGSWNGHSSAMLISSNKSEPFSPSLTFWRQVGLGWCACHFSSHLWRPRGHFYRFFPLPILTLWWLFGALIMTSEIWARFSVCSQKEWEREGGKRKRINGVGRVSVPFFQEAHRWLFTYVNRAIFIWKKQPLIT